MENLPGNNLGRNMEIYALEAGLMRGDDDEFDRLFQEGLEETEPGKREAIYLRMQEIMEDTGAYVWLTHEPSVMVYQNSVDPVIYPDAQLYAPGFEWITS